MIEVLLWPFVAGIVLTLIHVWFGLHVLARGVVFVDLSLAQMAALGLTAAILVGHGVQSDAAYWYALAFALGGALLFALVRRFERAIPQEAVIGIVYAVSASLAVLALDRAPQGAEHIKQLLIGSILTVTPQEVGAVALLYALIGSVHWWLRAALIETSFAGANAVAGRALWWDTIFYGSFALVVTSSVRIAGVLLVFAYLIVPAALAGLFNIDLRGRLLVGWMLGIALTGVGLYASWHWDLPTGPAIVTVFGGATALVGAAFAARKIALRSFAIAILVAMTVAGLALIALPRMDQPWFDALESIAPRVQTTFLTDSERATRNEALQSIARAENELATLRSLEQDVRWGTKEMTQEKAERLRQYIAGRSEISAGEKLVLRDMGRKARERQRLVLGIPLIGVGAGGLYWICRKRTSP